MTNPTGDAPRAAGYVQAQGGAWADPTPDMLDDPQFNAIWSVIKSWDVNVPSQYSGYCGTTGNHARAILDALTAVNSHATLKSRNAELEAECARIERNRDLWKAQVDRQAERLTVVHAALKAIAGGEGYYGAQAREYKEIARAALSHEGRD